MSRLASLTAAVFLSLAIPAGAGARNMHLAMARGQAMIRAHAALDEPTNVVLSGCYKPSARSVACWVTEFGAHTLIYDNGEAIVGDLSYEGVARG